MASPARTRGFRKEPIYGDPSHAYSRSRQSKHPFWKRNNFREKAKMLAPGPSCVFQQSGSADSTPGSCFAACAPHMPGWRPGDERERGQLSEPSRAHTHTSRAPRAREEAAGVGRLRCRHAHTPPAKACLTLTIVKRPGVRARGFMLVSGAVDSYMLLLRVAGSPPRSRTILAGAGPARPVVGISAPRVATTGPAAPDSVRTSPASPHVRGRGALLPTSLHQLAGRAFVSHTSKGPQQHPSVHQRRGGPPPRAGTPPPGGFSAPLDGEDDDDALEYLPRQASRDPQPPLVPRESFWAQRAPSPDAARPRRTGATHFLVPTR
ncbi:hypothetical protein GGTG_11599 [Gaeumannomyces tritici R3-111a-1]|uniref:Uncharacterized protein n=1 Tax=Gaeumannomyces tritici (strain R3-111a-1) TaxID=644352 RepID=J3PDM6_GAET3|nr:hypothetical protein GGTG_11599 [Gaeumannomyces tritici R3-111a-1]EJT70576.1 hypothetical protein GGTG_11599 [Gaeumannomyces tritici R3-111a-1]